MINYTSRGHCLTSTWGSLHKQKKYEWELIHNYNITWLTCKHVAKRSWETSRKLCSLLTWIRLSGLWSTVFTAYTWEWLSSGSPCAENLWQTWSYTNYFRDGWKKHKYSLGFKLLHIQATFTAIITQHWLLHLHVQCKMASMFCSSPEVSFSD